MSSSSHNVTAVAVPKHSLNKDDHALIFPSTSNTSAIGTDSTANNATNKGSSTLAAFSRALAATLAFMFKRPIRLFRPVKISTWAGIQAIAHEQGLSKVNASFIRGLIRKEGVRFPTFSVTPSRENKSINPVESAVEVLPSTCPPSDGRQHADRIDPLHDLHYFRTLLPLLFIPLLIDCTSFRSQRVLIRTVHIRISRWSGTIDSLSSSRQCSPTVA